MRGSVIDPMRSVLVRDTNVRKDWAYSHFGFCVANLWTINFEKKREAVVFLEIAPCEELHILN